MPVTFLKTKACGCIVRTIVCGINKDKMFLIAGHKHVIICEKCKLDEENGDDTLYDMWTNDNITDRFGFNEWIEENK